MVTVFYNKPITAYIPVAKMSQWHNGDLRIEKKCLRCMEQNEQKEKNMK
jgi:hypothetical protein